MKSDTSNAKRHKEILMFKKHYDTGKLRHHINSIPAGARIIITEKLHGTSGRTGLVLVEKSFEELPTLEKIVAKVSWKLLNFFGIVKNKVTSIHEWTKITGSRNVTLEFRNNDKDYYNDTSFRKYYHDYINPRKGEIIYYEIVGYTGEKPIMASHTLDKSDAIKKDLSKKYGSTMDYSYSCGPGVSKIFVYRITQTNEDNHVVELSWEQVKARCRDLALTPVPELVRDYKFTSSQELLDLCEKLSSGASELDSKHIKEGVCIRIEDKDQQTCFKYKSFAFCHLEGIAKNLDSYVDLEEIS